MEQEMETSDLNSDNSESSSITNSWVLLSTNEATITPVPEENQSIPEKLNDITDELLKSSSFEDIQSSNDFSSNKSDAESDGISIISESEFFQIRSDDDSCTNSSDENTSDNFKTQSDVQSEDSNQLQKSLAVPIKIQEISNVPPPANENIETTRKARTSIIISKRKEPKTQEPNLKTFLFEFVEFNLFWIVGIIVMALTSSFLSCFTSNRNSYLGRGYMTHMDKNLLNSDEFENLGIYTYCKTIYEGDRFSENTSQCTRRIKKKMKEAKEIKQTEKDNTNKQRLFSENGASKNEAPDVIFNKSYDDEDNNKNDCETNDEIHAKEKYQLDNKSIKKSNGNLERIGNQENRNNYGQKLFSYENERSFDKAGKHSKDQLSHEEEKLNNWKIQLLKTEKRLIKWEAELKEKEKKLDIYGACDGISRREYYPKKNKHDRYDNKYTYQKNKEYQSNLHKKKFKSSKNSDDKHKIRRNQNNWPVKDKKNHPFQIRETKTKLKTVVNDKKWKNLKVPYNQKKNQSSVIDDNNTITGEWYLNQLQGRSDIRKKEGKARWWFDRANLRKIKRNRAYWYFQYMFNRENLRYEPEVF